MNLLFHKCGAFLAAALVALGAGAAPALLPNGDFESADPLGGWKHSDNVKIATASGDWLPLTARFNTGDDSVVNIYIVSDKHSLGHLRLDNFRSVPAVELPNSGFEDGLAGWAIDNVTLDREAAAEGTQSVLMYFPIDIAPQATLTRAVPVQPHTDYVFTIDALVGADFQGDCKFLVYDQIAKHCILVNYGEPFAANIVADRDLCGARLVQLSPTPGKPASLSRTTTLPEAGLNLSLYADVDMEKFDGTLRCLVRESASGKILRELELTGPKSNWQPVALPFSTAATAVEVAFEAAGNGVVRLDNVSLDHPQLIPQPREAVWHGAGDNFPIPAELLVSVTGAAPQEFAGALELLNQDLAPFQRTARFADDANAAIQLRIGDKYALPGHESEGYTFRSGSDGVIIEAGTARGAFNGMMTLLGLLTESGGELVVIACDIRDWPDLEIRGMLYADIEQAARWKFNTMMISTGCPETPEELANIDAVAEQCRALQMEFIPFFMTMSSGYYVERKNPSFAAGEFIADERVTLQGETPTALHNPYVIRTNLSDVKVRNAATGLEYSPETDYKVIDGDMQFNYTMASPRPFTIVRTAGSAIADGETVSVSYDFVSHVRNGRRDGNIPFCPLEPEVRQLTDDFIAKIADRYQPRYIHTGTCLMEFGPADNMLATDSRVRNSGKTPMELYREENLLHLDAMRRSSPGTGVLAFTGDLNDYSRSAAEAWRGHDITMIIWGYDANYPTGPGREALEFWSAQGIASVVMPWENVKNIRSFAKLAKEAAEAGEPCLGMIGSGWEGRCSGFQETAEAAWNVNR